VRDIRGAQLYRKELDRKALDRSIGRRRRRTNLSCNRTIDQRDGRCRWRSGRKSRFRASIAVYPLEQEERGEAEEGKATTFGRGNE
jgi:hypothetical protein